MPRYVFATASQVVKLGKYTERIRRGEARYADDPVVVAHPECFQDEPVDVVRTSGWEPAVEQMTAAPGEKRTVRRGG